jgi:hypothetical protein
VQKEIETLVAAWTQEQEREVALVRNLLSSLAVHAAARRRLISDVATAAVSALDNPQQPTSQAAADAITQAIKTIRQERASLHGGH